MGAVPAFEAAPTNPAAVFYRNGALCFFLIAAFLLLAAALIDTLANDRAASEVIGRPRLCGGVRPLCPALSGCQHAIR
jgi:hypothetical protein